MNGLDKIIAQILDDAKQESLAIQEKAAGEAETTLAAAGEKVKKLEEEQAKSAAQREKSYEERLRSSAALKKRQAILAAKQAIIEEMLAAAHKELLAKPDEAYFAWMEQLLSRFVTDRAGEIYVSKRDLERMPDDFPAKIEKTAQEKGGSLVLKKNRGRSTGALFWCMAVSRKIVLPGRCLRRSGMSWRTRYMRCCLDNGGRR